MNAYGQTGPVNGERMLLAYYGDDFTGSTDALEALSAAGLKTVLFLTAPTAELLQRKFPGMACVGLAGVGRSLDPAELERELHPALVSLRKLGAAIVHYKVCSTFDSAPHIGSIGRALDIGRDLFGGCRYVPLLAGVPRLGRYTLFGHHFAASPGGDVYRLDRHPTMSAHPLTPMEESDLRLHLNKQTDASVGLLDLLAQEGSCSEVRERLERLVAAGHQAVLFDVLDERRLETVGALLWEEAHASVQHGLFAVGSSGIESALTAHWRRIGIAPDSMPANASPGPVDRLLVVSGSCSPVTEGQLDYAAAAGFERIRVPVRALLQQASMEQVRSEICRSALSALAAGRSVALYTAAGPGDGTIGEARAELSAQGLRPEDSGMLLGRQLGIAARDIAAAAGLKRIVVAGGDTSGYVTRELGVYALEWLAQLAPGGPLCRAHSDDPRLDGLQLALKGGQVGGADYFVRALQGQ